MASPAQAYDGFSRSGGAEGVFMSIRECVLQLLLIVIPVLIDSGRPAKANLSLDSGLLDAIDDAAKASGLTRSSFIATAAREKIAHVSA